MRKAPAKRKRGLLRRVLIWLALAVAGFYALVAIALVGLKWIDPPTTTVQIERRVQALAHRRPYHKRYAFVPLGRISKDLQHAVLAAEDERFFEHHGIDWTEVHKVVDRDLDRSKLGRGASTITQQLVKNLFLSTSRSMLRKAIEIYARSSGRFHSGKAARARAVSECDRVGAGNLWRRGRGQLLLRRAGDACGARTGRAPGRGHSFPAHAQAAAYGTVERRHPRSHAQSGLVTVSRRRFFTRCRCGRRSRPRR